MQFMSRFARLTVQNRSSISRLVTGIEIFNYDIRNSTTVSNDGLPSKPKKPLNLFLRFSSEVRPKVVAENPNAKMIEIASILGEMWKKTDDDFKKHLKTSIEEDVKNYKVQLAAYNEYLKLHPEVKIKKNQKTRKRKLNRIKNQLKQLGYPTRPGNAVALFFLSKKHTKPADMKSMDFMKSLRNEWLSLPDSEKQKLKDRHKQLLEQYWRDVDKWLKSPDPTSDMAKIKTKLLNQLKVVKSRSLKPKKITLAYLEYINTFKKEKPEELSKISWMRELNRRWDSMSTAEKEKYDQLTEKSEKSEQSKVEKQKTTKSKPAGKAKTEKSKMLNKSVVLNAETKVQTILPEDLPLEETRTSTVAEKNCENRPMSVTKTTIHKQSVQVVKKNLIKDIYENVIGFFRK